MPSTMIGSAVDFMPRPRPAMMLVAAPVSLWRAMARAEGLSSAV